MSVFFLATEQITTEVLGRPDLNFIANVPIEASVRFVQTVAAIRGLDEDHITKMVLWQIKHTFDTLP